MSLRLDRRAGQSITIPGETPSDDVVVKVHSIEIGPSGTPRVRLEVAAHPEQGIFRTELWQRLEREQAADGRSRGG